MPFQVRWTPERLEELERMIKSKKPYEEIAEHYNIRVSTVRKVIWKYHLKDSRKWNEEALEELQKMLDAKIPYKQIAAHYGITEISLNKVISGNKLRGKKYRENGEIKWDDKSLSEVQKMINEGVPYKEIAEKYGMGIKSFYTMISMHSLKGKSRRIEWTPENLKTISQMVKEGFSRRAIAYKYKVSQYTICNLIDKYDLRA